MTESEKQRLVELRFYCIVKDISNSFSSNWLDVLDLIGALAIIGKYNGERVKILANNIMSDPLTRPNHQEQCVLGQKAGLKIRPYCRILGIHHTTLARTAEQHKSMFIYPRLNATDRVHIMQFISTIEKIKGVATI